MTRPSKRSSLFGDRNPLSFEWRHYHGPCRYETTGSDDRCDRRLRISIAHAESAYAARKPQGSHREGAGELGLRADASTVGDGGGRCS